MNITFSGRKAVVCGSSKGIGLAIAKQLAVSGAQVMLIARNEGALRLAVAQLAGSGHAFKAADLSNRAELLLLQAELKNYSPDILINNAGGPPPGLVSDAKPEQFLAALDMHLFAAHLLTQGVLPDMKQRKFGRIINIISTSVKIPLHGLGVSNTVRGAVASWAKTLSNEVGIHGITVNSILPGFVETDRLAEIIAVNSEKSGKKKADIVKQMLAQVPAQRFGKPEEAAALACFLASDLAGYINGTAIPLDGGRTGSI